MQSLLKNLNNSLEKPSNFKKILTILGGLLLLRKAVSLSSFLYSHFMRIPYDLKLRYGDKSFVLISAIRIDSLLCAFIDEFSARGFNILIFSEEDPKQFETFFETIQNKNKNQIKILSKFEESELYEVSVLILHRASGLKYKRFLDFSEQKVEKAMSLSIFASLLQTKRLLRRFAVRPLKSAIINLGSFTGDVPCPYYALHSAINAFQTLFFRSLSYENNENVDILSLNPLFVSERKKFCGVHSVSPKDCARECLRVLGKQNRCFGGARSEFQAGRLNSMSEGRKVRYFSNYLKRFLTEK